MQHHGDLSGLRRNDVYSWLSKVETDDNHGKSNRSLPSQGQRDSRRQQEGSRYECYELAGPSKRPTGEPDGERTKERNTVNPNKRATPGALPDAVYADAGSNLEPGTAGPYPGKTYERKRRHKTRKDRYEPKAADDRVRQPSGQKQKRQSTRSRLKKGDGRKGKLEDDFRASNVLQGRLTLKAGFHTALFSRGHASAPTQRRDLPDLSFSEMAFLSKDSNQKCEAQANPRTVGHENSSRGSPPSILEISNYFSREQLGNRTSNEVQERTAGTRKEHKTQSVAASGNIAPRPPPPQERSLQSPGQPETRKTPLTGSEVCQGATSSCSTHYTWPESNRGVDGNVPHYNNGGQQVTRHSPGLNVQGSAIQKQCTTDPSTSGHSHYDPLISSKVHDMVRKNAYIATTVPGTSKQDTSAVAEIKNPPEGSWEDQGQAAANGMDSSVSNNAIETKSISLEPRVEKSNRRQGACNNTAATQTSHEWWTRGRKMDVYNAGLSTQGASAPTQSREWRPAPAEDPDYQREYFDFEGRGEKWPSPRMGLGISHTRAFERHQEMFSDIALLDPTWSEPPIPSPTCLVPSLSREPPIDDIPSEIESRFADQRAHMCICSTPGPNVRDSDSGRPSTCNNARPPGIQNLMASPTRQLDHNFPEVAGIGRNLWLTPQRRLDSRSQHAGSTCDTNQYRGGYTHAIPSFACPTPDCSYLFTRYPSPSSVRVGGTTNSSNRMVSRSALGDGVPVPADTPFWRPNKLY